MSKKKQLGLVYLVTTILLGLYVFESAPNLNPLYQDGAFFWAVVVTIYVGIWGLYRAGSGIITLVASREETKVSLPKWAMVVVAIPWIFVLVMMLYGSVFFQWKTFRDQLGEPEVKKFTNEVQAVDVDQIPIVDEALALQLAQKKLGERPALGSQVYLRDATIQMVDGELVWVVPLYHSGFFKWLTNLDGTPGYIVVSATNTNNVRYVEGHKIKYQPNSYLLFDVTRKVRFSDGLFTGITDYSFELDDDGQPYWVVSTYKNRVGFSLPEATGIILLNATTGEMQQYGMDDLPEWVDRVQPEQFVMEQINNRGRYVHGIFNFANKDKYMASDGHNIVYNNGRCYLFTGLTSVGTDDSAIGFMMVDMVTKESIMYEMSGATEEAAQRSAEGRVQDLGYYASFPIILNIDNQPTYFMTLKDSIGLIKQYASVSVVNFSTVGTGESMSTALRDYEDKLLDDGLADNTFASGSTGESVSVTGTVQRVAGELNNGSTVYYLILTEEPQRIFAASSSLSPELALTQPGDQVTLSYLSSAAAAQEVTAFDNLLFSQDGSAPASQPAQEAALPTEEPAA